MYVTVRGLVLRVSAYNDTDAMLTLLTQEYGMLSVKARGLRRKNSPLIAPCQLLAFGEFTLFEYKGFYVINEAHTIELFQGLRKDLQKLALGTYFAQVSETVCQEDIPNPELLTLLLNCLYALSNKDFYEIKVKAAFEVRCACIAGYTPDIVACHSCGKNYADRFDISQGHLECSSCRDHSSNGIRMPIVPGVLDAMRYLCICHPKKILSFSISDAEILELSRIAESYLTTQLEKSFSTLDFYKSLLV